MAAKKRDATPISTDTGKARPEVTYIEDVNAPELYADDAAYFFLKNGNIAITLVSGRLDAGPDKTAPFPVRRVVVSRVILPTRGAQGLAVGLYDFLVGCGLGPNKSNPNN